MPFILYDRVTIDTKSFSCLLGARPSLSNWRPSAASVTILERLAADGIIQLEDYVARLSGPGTGELLDQLNVLDLCDANLLEPAVESLALWVRFYKDLFGFTDQQLGAIHDAMAALTTPGRNPSDALGYVYECVSDINRLLVLAQDLELPIYEWEDYRRYYRYKFLRSAQASPERSEGQTLQQLFQVFIPKFAIREYDELVDIRTDKRLDAVRRLVDGLEDKPIDKDLVIQAHQDVLLVKRRLSTFTRYVGYAGWPLGLVPGILGTAAQEISNLISKRWLEKRVRWQLFFVERALSYSEREAADMLRSSDA